MKNLPIIQAKEVELLKIRQRLSQGCGKEEQEALQMAVGELCTEINHLKKTALDFTKKPFTSKKE